MVKRVDIRVANAAIVASRPTSSLVVGKTASGLIVGKTSSGAYTTQVDGQSTQVNLQIDGAYFREGMFFTLYDVINPQETLVFGFSDVMSETFTKADTCSLGVTKVNTDIIGKVDVTWVTVGSTLAEISLRAELLTFSPSTVFNETSVRSELLTVAASAVFNETSARSELLSFTCAFVFNETRSFAEALSLSPSAVFNETSARVESISIAAAPFVLDTRTSSEVVLSNIGKGIAEASLGVEQLTADVSSVLAEASLRTELLSFSCAFVFSETKLSAEAVAITFGKNVSESISYAEAGLGFSNDPYPNYYDTKSPIELFVVDYARATNEVQSTAESFAVSATSFYTDTRTSAESISASVSTFPLETSLQAEQLGKDITAPTLESKATVEAISNAPSKLINEVASNDNYLAFSYAFEDAYWYGYYTKPSFTVVNGPLGEVGKGRRFALDTGGGPGSVYAGILRDASTLPEGAKTVTIKARASEAISVRFGLDDNAATDIAVTTSWQQFTYTTTLTGQAGRMGQFHKYTNVAGGWIEIAEFQVGPGASAPVYRETNGLADLSVSVEQVVSTVGSSVVETESFIEAISIAPVIVFNEIESSIEAVNAFVNDYIFEDFFAADYVGTNSTLL
jgi:hypothetical protein